VTVIQNGVDLERFRGVRRHRDPNDPRLVVTFVGRLVPVKGLDVLIDAFGRIAADYPNVVLQLIGEGPLRSEIEGWVEARGLRTRVSLPGHCDDVLERLADSDVFVLPSRHEGLPISLLESMALGVPVVTTAVGGISEVVTSGVDGLLVLADSAPQLAAALSRTLCSRDLRGSLARAARATLEKRFSARAMADQYVQLYRGPVARA
jgi:glycosyltransferase involved in cell wall biosynthesis